MYHPKIFQENVRPFQSIWLKLNIIHSSVAMRNRYILCSLQHVDVKKKESTKSIWMCKWWNQCFDCRFDCSNRVNRHYFCICKSRHSIKINIFMTHLTGFCMIAVILSLFSAHVSLGTKMEASREREENIIDHFFSDGYICFALVECLLICNISISIKRVLFSFFCIHRQNGKKQSTLTCNPRQQSKLN